MKRMRQIENKVYKAVRQLEIEKGDASDAEVPSIECEEEVI